MYSRIARSSLNALTALVSICTIAGTAYADTNPKSIQTCSAAIIKAGASFVQAEAKILQKCRETALKGKVCDSAKTQASIDKAITKLRDGIVKKCYGKDKSCNTVDADGSQPTLQDIHWDIGSCPNFASGNCNNTINDCDDIPDCIQCIGEASVNQAIDLYYPPKRPASTDNKVLNKCQATIGKAAVTFLNAKSKALAKCWGTKVKKTANCPADAQEAIDKARMKFVDALAKPCPGLNNSTIGLPDVCPFVAPEGKANCSAPVGTLVEVGTCASCVTEFEVECPDRLSALSVGATYPLPCAVAPPPNCNNGVLDAGEVCDPTSSTTTCPNVNNAVFPCNPFTCTCDCPSKVTFNGTATDPASRLDSGWTGISHGAPVISDGDVTVALSCDSPTNGRPCGVCSVSGPIPNGPGKLDSQRCTNDTSIRCTNDTPCTAGGGTCQFFFGSNLSLAAGGVSTCVVSQFNGSVTGTANVESGEATSSALLTSRVYNGLAIDNPCPRCIGDTTINDGTQGGTCDDGPRKGQSCDANGAVPSRPDFGATSLDCPPDLLGLIATLPIDLSNSTAPVTRTVTTASPTCGDQSGERCLCDTCNNAAATPCQSNADCLAVGATICGGKRCLGGSNNGAPCVSSSSCPGGLCNRAGEPSQPSACLDDTATPGVLDCSDTTPVDGEGECAAGPVTKTCSVASGHGQRACGSDAACGGDPGSCEANNRPCFLTGSNTGNGKVGTTTLIAVGMADPPVNDSSNPTLAAVFCIGPTNASSVNTVAGLPGPGRITLKGLASGSK